MPLGKAHAPSGTKLRANFAEAELKRPDLDGSKHHANLSHVISANNAGVATLEKQLGHSGYDEMQAWGALWVEITRRLSPDLISKSVRFMVVRVNVGTAHPLNSE